MTSGGWTVRLSAAAAADFDAILLWTLEQFGSRQARAYAGRLAAAMARLEQGPAVPGARRREEIAPGLSTLHIGPRGRHIILFRIGNERRRALDVLRILHDAMDLARHVPTDE